jgi:predicted  nucleic acid-binding Zn-ribbon protein
MEKSRSRFSLFVSAFFLLAVLTGLWQRQELYDWLRLRNYQPSAQIVALANATTMNDQARRLFYVHHPSLDDKQAFNQNCTETENSIVLGCYIKHRGIYIFDVTDPRLNGIEEVTAAHEMLHAAYDRLNTKDRQRVDLLTAQAFEALKDERLNDTVERYRQRDATIVPNELHSILGTEVRNLPQELEDYYKKYFNNRAVIVALSEQYQQAFTERQNKIEEYDRELKSLQQRIESIQASLNSQESALDAERRRLDDLRARNQIEAYNAGVPGFNELVRRYNADVSTARSLIDRYNHIVAERNALAVEENELIEAIDSRPTTIETQ